MRKKMKIPSTSDNVAMNGAEVRAGSPPSDLMSSGSIAPITAPVKQIPITANVTTQFNRQKYSPGTFDRMLSGVRKYVRATDSTPRATASASATNNSRRKILSQSRV